MSQHSEEVSTSFRSPLAFFFFLLDECLFLWQLFGSQSLPLLHVPCPQLSPTLKSWTHICSVVPCLQGDLNMNLPGCGRTLRLKGYIEDMKGRSRPTSIHPYNSFAFICTICYWDATFRLDDLRLAWLGIVVEVVFPQCGATVRWGWVRAHRASCHCGHCVFGRRDALQNAATERVSANLFGRNRRITDGWTCSSVNVKSLWRNLQHVFFITQLRATPTTLTTPTCGRCPVFKFWAVLICRATFRKGEHNRVNNCYLAVVFFRAYLIHTVFRISQIWMKIVILVSLACFLQTLFGTPEIDVVPQYQWKSWNASFDHVHKT